MNPSGGPAYSKSLGVDLDRGPRRIVLAMVASIAGFLLIAVVWMAFASLDVAVHAMGAVIPSSRVQNIQSLEGGIIKQIKVREGQRVKRGQVLGYVENLQYNAELGEGQQSYWAAEAARARLTAELNGRTPQFSAELRANVPGLVAEQRRLWDARQQELSSALARIRDQVAQREKELAEAQARVESLDELMGPARELVVMEKRLLTEDAGARADYLAALREATRIKGELTSARIQVDRQRAALNEANAELKATRAKYQAEASREFSELGGKSAVLAQQLTAQRDKVKRRELRSPMDGVVNRVLISTVGGVAKPGETIMELVPDDKVLLIAARVKPSDIAFIHSGQSASVRITAYDSSIFGSLQGKVVRVGADSVLDDQKNPYFEVFLETEKNYLGSADKQLSISPGMSADTSIQTGKRTLLEYLLKPVVKTLDKAFQER